MATFQEKLARFETAKANVEALVSAGVDLKSEAAVPAGLEFVNAFDDLAQEFGHKLLQPLRQRTDFVRPDPTTQR
jgi:hypothetical protein